MPSLGMTSPSSKLIHIDPKLNFRLFEYFCAQVNSAVLEVNTSGIGYKTCFDKICDQALLHKMQKKIGL